MTKVPDLSDRELVGDLQALVARVLPPSSWAAKLCAEIVACLPAQPSIEFLAHRLGLPDRRRLAERLAAEGHPSAVQLRRYVLVAYNVIRWQALGGTLDSLARLDGKEPSTYYRAVREAAGRPWTSLKRERPSGFFRMAVELERLQP